MTNDLKFSLFTFLSPLLDYPFLQQGFHYLQNDFSDLSDFLAASITSLLFISHLNQICILVCLVGSVSYSYFFPVEDFSIFLSYLKNFYMIVVRIFNSKWLVEAKLKDLSLLSVHCVCLALLYLIFVIIMFEIALHWGFLADSHLKLPFVGSRDI